MTLDRIDNDGPYSPDNVQWATKQGQIENSSTIKLDWATVRKGRARVDSGESVKSVWVDIAQHVKYQTFLTAMNRKTWRESETTFLEIKNGPSAEDTRAATT